jgi:hypothetical protein
MLDVLILSSAMLVAAAAVETPPGDPFSPERHTYCEAERMTCEEEGVAACTSDSPPGYADDARTWCSKEYTTRFEYGGDQPTPTSTPTPTLNLPPRPAAPTSCHDLFSRLRQFVGVNNPIYLTVVWTTNYLAHGHRYAGRARLLNLAREGRRFDLYGRGTRYRANYSGEGLSEEKVSLRILADDRIMLSDIYGPYDAVCSAFRDWSSERTGFAREVCEMALAHTIKDKAEAAYRRGDLFEKRRKLMEAWSAYVTKEPAKVIQLQSA